MIPRVRDDALPEGIDHPDNGCSLHPSCLTCPLPGCRYEALYRIQELRADLRALEAQRLRRQGAGIVDVMRALTVSRRTAYRLVKRPVPELAMSGTLRVTLEGGARGV